MARTLSQWREAILAWHTTGVSDGPVEGWNSMIKKVKRVAAGFRDLTNYRTRIMLVVVGCNWALLGTPTALETRSAAKSTWPVNGGTLRGWR